MSLNRLVVRNVRNICHTEILPHPQLNLIVGPNGSGKTSLLESIYLLGTGRSYRNTQIDPLIHRESPACTVFGTAKFRGKNVSLGIERKRNGSKEIRINGDVERLTSRLAKELPILYLGPDTVEVLVGAPTVRRRFLNWGVFHVEPSFADDWLQANRCLKQRNHLLRSGQGGTRQFSTWTAEFVQYAKVIDASRRRYFERFEACFSEICASLTDLSEIKCTYYRGWNESALLEKVLSDSSEAERKRGFTQAGFHRADIKVNIAGQPASQTCSRGELKILSWAMVLAQGKLVQENEVRSITYLVDDLHSELDVKHRQGVCSLLEQTDAQIFATGIDIEPLRDCWQQKNERVFHVKHGNFSPEEIDNE